MLTVDLGKTTCRAVLTTPDGPITMQAPGAPGLAAQEGVEAALRSILALGIPLRDNRIGVGSAGALVDRAATVTLADRLVEEGAREVMVTSDITTAHAGALGGDPGVVLVAGTGAVCLGVDSTGRVRRVDGWGPLLGDLGSGGWIGREALVAVLAAYDGRGAETTLLEAADIYGSIDSLPTVVRDARECGRFVPYVAEAARDGDAVALGILRSAAEALANTVCATVTEPAAAVVVGGLVSLGPILLDPLRHNVSQRAEVDWRDPLGDALEGAALLLGRRDTAHEGHVVRRE